MSHVYTGKINKSEIADAPNLTDFRMSWIRNKMLTLLRIKDQNEWTKMIGRNNFYVYKRLVHFIECEGSPDGLNRDDGIFIVFKSGYPKRYKKEIFFRKIATKVKTFTRSVSVAPVSKSKKKSGKRNSSGKGGVKPLKVTPKKITIKASPSKPGSIVKRDSLEKSEKKGQSNDKRRSTKRGSGTAGVHSPSTVIGGVEKYKVAIKECIKLKKIIKKIKLHDQLHGHFGYPKQFHDDTIYAYIIRKLITPIPVFDRYSEAEAELPSFFLVGTFNGRYARCAHSTLQAHFLCLRDSFMDPSNVAMESAGCVKHPDEILQNIGYPADIMSSPTFMPKLRDCCKGINDCLPHMRAVTKIFLLKKILKLKSDIIRFDIEHDSRYTIDDLVKKEKEIDFDNIYTMKTILTKDIQTISNDDLAELFLEIRYSIYYKRNIDPIVEFRKKPEPMKYNLLYFLNHLINGVTRFTETMKWTEIILSSANISLFNLIKKRGDNRHIQLKILAEDPRFIAELTSRMLPWTNYINSICNLLENANLGKNILHLYYSSKNTFMIIWPILAHIDKSACMRNSIKIMKCTNPRCYIQFLDATKRLRLNFRNFFYTALFLAPFLEDIKVLSSCENLSYLEKSWKNLNTFSTMLRTFYTSGSTAFNQLASIEESENFSIGKIILNIHEKLAPMYIRMCEKVFFDNWPKLKLRNLERLCKRIPEFLKDYKGYVDEKFYDFISGKSTEKQQYNQYVETVAEHCLQLSIMAKVLRYFKHIFGVLFPTMPRTMVYQNILKSSLRDIMTQLFATRLNIFDIKPDENALLNEWFWTAIRQLSVVAVDVIDLTFDDLTSSMGAMKYMSYHEKNRIDFFLYDKLLSKYPKIMDRYIQEANEFHDILVRSCPNPPRIYQFPFYTNRLYFLRFIASSSYGIFRKIIKVPEISSCPQSHLGERWKNYNVQKAANLEFVYINQFLKHYLYEFEDICSTKCLKIVQKPGAKWPFKECYYKHLISKLLKKYFIPQDLAKEYDSLDEESMDDEEAIKTCLKKLLVFQNRLNTYKWLSESEEASESEGREKSEMFLFNQQYCLDMIISNYDRYANKPLFKFLKPPLDTKYRKNIRFRPTLCKLPRPKHGESFDLYIDDATNPIRRFYLFPISNKSMRTILNKSDEKSMDVDKFLSNLRRIDKKATCPVRNRYTHFNPNWWKIFTKRNPCYKLRKYKWIPYKPADATVANLCYDVQDLNKLHTTWAESYGDSLMAEHHFTFEVNFDEKYYNVMSEVNQLRLLGYNLPEEFENILAHMKLIVKRLQVMSLSVKNFNKLYDSMPRHHITVLKPHIIPLEMYLRYACKSLSWGRSWLDSWLKSVDQRILYIRKKNLAITEKKRFIAGNLKEVMTNTFEFPQDILLPQKFFSYLTVSHAERLLHLRNCQRKVADKLIELEWELYGSESGSHELFGSLYRKVERAFKDCLVRSLMKDLNNYKNWLEDEESSKIRIQLEFVDGKLSINPSIKLLHKILSNIVFGIVKTQCRIPRWLNKSVHEAPRMLVERYLSPAVDDPPLHREQADWDRKLDPLYFMRPKTYLWGRTENLSEWFNQVNPLHNYNHEAGLFLTSKYSPPRSIQRIDKEKIKEKIIKLNYKYAEAYKSKDYVDYTTFNTVWYNEFLPTNLERCVTIDELSDSSESFLHNEDELSIFDKNLSETEELSQWDMDKDIESIEDSFGSCDDDSDANIITKTTNIPMLEPIYFDEMPETQLLQLCPLMDKLKTVELEKMEVIDDVKEEEELESEEDILEELIEAEDYDSDSEACELLVPESKKSSTEYLPLGEFSSSEDTVYSFDFMKYLNDIGIKTKESKIEYQSVSTASSEPYDLIDVDTLHKLFKAQIWWKTEADKAGGLIRKLDIRNAELDQLSMYTDSERYINNEDYMINKFMQMREKTTQHKRRLDKLRILKDPEHGKGSRNKFAIKKSVIDRGFHRYTYVQHLIGNRKIVKTILEIQQRHIKLFEELNSYKVRWSEVLQIVIQQRSKYEHQKPTFVESLMEIEQIDSCMKYLEEFGACVDVGCLRLEFESLYETSLNILQVTRRIHLHGMLGEIEYLLVKNYKFLKNAVVSLKTELTTLKSFHEIMYTIDEIKKMANYIWWEFWICNVQITTLELQKLFNVSPLRRLFKVMCQLWDRAWLSAYYRKYFIEYAFDVLNTKVLRMIKSYEELCADCVRRYYLEGPGSILEDWEDAMELQLAFLKEFIDVKIVKPSIEYTQNLFALPRSDYTAFNAAYDECVNLPQLDAINLKLQKFEGDYGECSWKKIRISDAMQELIKIQEAMIKLPDSLKQHQIIERVKKFITNYEILLNPLLGYLLSPSLADRHWEKIFLLADHQKPENVDALKVNDLYKLRLFRFTAEIESILRTADLEWYTQRFLDDCAEFWSNFSFVTEDHFVEIYIRSTLNNEIVWEKCRKNRGKMIANLDEIKVTLNDYLISFQLKQNYKHAVVHHSCMRGWQDVLSLCTEVVSDLEKTQKSWVLIERIFFSNHFHEATILDLFTEIDNGFHQIMKGICATPHVIHQCQRIYNGTILTYINEKLQECLGMVNDYLNEKRQLFPRFFFVNNEELLAILGAMHPSSVRPYISKLFTNVANFIIYKSDPKNQECINGVISYEHEKFEFSNAVDFQAPVEGWISKVLYQVKLELKLRIKQCIYDLTYVNVEARNIDWIMDNLGISGLIAHSVWWVKDVENALKFEKGLGEIRTMVRQRLEEVKDALRNAIKKIDRVKLTLYYLFYCQIRDIIENLIYEKVICSLDFGWKRHLRHYWQRDVDSLIMRQCAGGFEYGFEYMGLKQPLVVTPVTSRIFLAMTQAIGNMLGCAVVGPAGVGKNETIKDLARIMGRFIVVCACNETIDYATIDAKIKGCCMSGCWLMLDKFGRLTQIIQNLITRDIQLIFDTLRGTEQKTTYMGKYFAFFLTLRTENYCVSKLNGCLKKQLRIITYVYPDLDKICQTLLSAEGFTNIQSLSKKILCLFRNGPPGIIVPHLGAFNLKEMITLLKIAGSVKSRWPNVTEESTIVTAIKIVYQPKLTDEKALGLLLEDMFTGIPIIELEDDGLVDKIKFILSEKQYLYIPQQVQKIGELYTVLQSHHSAIIVGPTCSGKSVIINVLTTIDGEVDDYTRRIIISPKAFPLEEFYGVKCPITNEWTDGYLTSGLKYINKNPSVNSKYYLIFDGQMDPSWVDDLISLLDDKKMITLPNNETLHLNNNVALLFETGSIQHLSPGILSRIGIVHVTSSDLPYRTYWTKFLLERKDADMLNQFYEKYIPQLIDATCETTSSELLETSLTFLIPQCTLSLIIQFCELLSSLIPPPKYYSDESSSEYEDLSQVVVEAYFITAIYFSFGANITYDCQAVFDNFMKELTTFSPYEDKDYNYAPLYTYPVLMPTMYDYFVDSLNECWLPWKAIVTPYQHYPGVSVNYLFVPTAGHAKIMWLLQQMKQAQRPTILLGETCSSKTALMKEFLRRQDPEENIFLYTTFSYGTSAKTISGSFQPILQKCAKEMYNMSANICIDDLNAPRVDAYGSQEPLAYLKMLIEKDGANDLQLPWKHYKNFFLFGAITWNGASTKIDPRFLSQFSIFFTESLSAEHIKLIYTVILKHHTKEFYHDVRNMVPELVHVTNKILKILAKDLPPLPSRLHYTFNIYETSRVIDGLFLIDPKVFKTTDQMFRIWRNEFLRSVADKLVNEEDRKYVDDIIEKEVSNLRQEDFLPYIMANPSLFADFRSAALQKKEERYYEDILDYRALHDILLILLVEYNAKFEPLDVTLIVEAMEHIIKIHRVLRMRNGNMLLVSPRCYGKLTLTKLASFIAECGLFIIETDLGYGEQSFIDDIKTLLEIVGIHKLHTALYISDKCIQPVYMTILDSLLATGSVPWIYSDDEINNIHNIFYETVAQLNLTPSRYECWKMFANNCKKHLHLIIGLDQSVYYRNELNFKFTNYPALLKFATVNWILPITKESLIDVATICLKREPSIPRIYKKSLARCVALMHDSSSYCYALYKVHNHYLGFKNVTDLIVHFAKLYLSLKKEIEEKNFWLKKGVESYYHCMKHLIEQNANLSMRLVVIAKLSGFYLHLAKMNLTLSKSIVEKINIVNLINEELKYLKELIIEYRLKLYRATYMSLHNFVAARKDLLNVTEEELDSFRKPNCPIKTVKHVSLALCAIITDDTLRWAEAHKLIGQHNFMDMLKRAHPKKVTKVTVDFVKNLLKGKEVCTCSSVERIYGIFVRYLRRFIEFHATYSAQQTGFYTMRIREQTLKKTYSRMLGIVENVRFMKCKVSRNLKLMPKILCLVNGIKADIPVRKRYVSEVGKLVVLLREEFIRWHAEYKTLLHTTLTLIGTTLLLSGFLNYLGPLNGLTRKKLLRRWRRALRTFHIPVCKKIDLSKPLLENWEIPQWQENGLRCDQFSLQNAILTMKSYKCPMLIDPEKQMITFLENMYESCAFYEVSIDDPEFKNVAKEAIKMGAALLIKNVYAMNKTLESLVKKHIIDEIEYQMMKFDGEVFIYNTNFQIFLCSGPDYHLIDPELYYKTNVINANIYLESLVPQINDLIYSIEFPTYNQLLIDISYRLNYLETHLGKLRSLLYQDFYRIRNTLLENEEVKLLCQRTHIEKIMIIAELNKLTNEKALIIDDTRRYKTIAIKLAIMYMSLREICVINPLCVHSLEVFMDIISFTVTIPYREDKEIIGPKKMVELVPLAIYKYIISGFLNKDKLLLAFYLATRWQLYDQYVDLEKVNYIIRDCTQIGPEEEPEVPWLSRENWTDVVHLAQEFPYDFDDLIRQIADPMYTARWQKWYEAEYPEIDETPQEEYNDYCMFRKLLLIKCLRKDRLYPAIKLYVDRVLGEGYLENFSFNFKQLFLWNIHNGPVLFIEYNDAKIMDRLMNHAKECGQIGDVTIITIGQLTDEEIVEAYRRSTELESWLIIKDCYLWTDKLNEILELNASLGQIYEEKYTSHRLWLITYYTAELPYELLVKSLKVVVQNQKCLREEMNYAMSALSENYIELCGNKYFGLVLYALTFVHGVLNVRSKFGKVCWNISYDFGQNAYKLCADMIAYYMADLDDLSESCINWEYIKYLLGDVFYGGQTLDHYDSQLINVYIDEFFDDNLVLKNHMLWNRNLCKFKFTSNEDYTVNDYFNEIQKIPLDNAPELMGLQNNAIAYYYIEKSNYICESLAQIDDHCETADSVFNKYGEFLKRLIYSIKQKIPVTFDILKGEHEDEFEEISRIESVFQAELVRFNELIGVMIQTTDDLNKVLNRELAANRELEELAHNLFSGKIPHAWRSCAPDTTMGLAQWIHHFCQRARQYKNYTVDGLPSVVWLSGLHHPRAYLVALLVEACKQKHLPLSNASFYTEIIDMKQIQQAYYPRREEYHITGLHLQNASWDDNLKCIVKPNKFYPLTELIPLIKIIPYKRSADEESILVDKVLVPVYTTPCRKNIFRDSGVVFDATLPTIEHPGRWILHGLCLLLNAE